MKQIGWCIEELTRLTKGKNLPLYLKTNDDYIIANDTLSKVFNVALTLGKLVDNENFEKILFRLKDKDLNGEKFNKNHIKKLFNELQLAVNDLERFLIALRRILDIKNHELWKIHTHNLIILLNTQFTLNYEDLRDEFNVPLHTKDELKKLGIFNEHLKYFLE
jgi:hypothetical protein